MVLFSVQPDCRGIYDLDRRRSSSDWILSDQYGRSRRFRRADMRSRWSQRCVQ